MKSFKPRMCRSPRDFEEAARDWMLHWGLADARLTKAGPDDGIDIAAKGALAQVKSWMTPIGISEVQRLKGAAYDGQETFFFSLMAYTEAARRFADGARVNLFRFRGYDGSIEPVNTSAAAFLRKVDSVAKSASGSIPWGQDPRTILDIVTEALRTATEVDGYAIFAIRDSGNRFVQYGAPERLESVGRGYLDDVNPLSAQQLDRLAAIGWPKLEDMECGNFVYLSSEPQDLPALIAIAERTLVEVHGASRADEIDVTVKRWGESDLLGTC